MMIRKYRILQETRGNFFLALMIAGLLAGSASLRAQSTTYTNGQNNTGTLSTDYYAPGNYIQLMIASGTATQSGAITGSGSVQFNPLSLDTGTLMLTGTNTYGGYTALSYGALTIAAGGTVSDSNGYIGYTAGSTGSVTVDGAGSAWNNSSDLNVGEYGTVTLTISNSGTVTDASGLIGSLTNSTGGVTVNGTGSTWANSGGLTVGVQGTGTLMISNGGTVTDASGDIGEYGSSTGSVTVNGTGSTWANSGGLIVGYGGTATLMISSGGTVTVSGVYIGDQAGSNGTATVDGAGSILNDNSGSLYVGWNGIGALTISNSGTVTDSVGDIGDHVGITGSVTVTGTGSTWQNSNLVYVGEFGTGALMISSGGRVTDLSSNIGDQVGSTGSATVDGAGSVWSHGSGTLVVGVSGTGTLTISNGGAVTNGDGYIGYIGTGSATVDGAGSTWTNSGNLYVGEYGTGTLTISNGGRVSNGNGYIGDQAGSTGSVTVTGTGSTWNNGSVALVVGFNGTGTLTISSSGTVSASATYLAFTGAGQGTVNLNSGGVLQTGQVYNVGGSGGAQLNFNGGILQATGNSTDFIRNFTGTQVLLLSGGGTIDNGGHTITINSPFSGSGGLAFTGAGTTTLKGANTYTGVTTVDFGTLAVTGTGSISGASVNNFYVGYNSGDNAAMLVSGGGTVTGVYSLFVGAGGTGTLTISDGGTVSDSNGDIAYYLGFDPDGMASGMVTVTGTGSTWNNDGPLFVGYTGTATLNISSGGTVTDMGAIMGNDDGSAGSVTVTGAGSNWQNSGDLTVGMFGTATLNISSGGTVTDVDALIGYAVNSPGADSVTVDGAGSTWTNSGSLTVGDAGLTVTLAISNGGRVTDTYGYIGNQSPAYVLGSGSGSVTVDGTGSTWQNSNDLYVGFGGTGTLTLSNGGMVSASTVNLAFEDAGQGTVEIDSGGVLQTGQIITGSSTGGAQLNFNGGILQATGNSTDFISNFTGTEISLLSGGGTIDNGGHTITINSPFSGSGGLAFTGASTTTLTAANTYTGNTTINAGTLAMGSGGSIANSSGVNLAASGATFDLSSGGNQTIRDLSGVSGSTVKLGGNALTVGTANSTEFNGAIQGSGGSLVKQGTGTLTLAGTNTYTGGTTISAGTLAVNGSVAGNVSVGSGGTLGGGGTVGGKITVAGGGSTYPGDPQILTANSVEYQDGSTAQFSIATTSGSSHPPTPGVDYDQVKLTSGGLQSLLIDPGTTTLQLNLNATSLAALQANAAGGIDDLYFVFDLGSGTSTGQFSDLTVTEGGNTYTDAIIDGTVTFAQLGLQFDLSYTASGSNNSMTGGNDVAFSVTSVAVVPEPSTWTLLLGGLGLLAYWSTRKRRVRN